MSRQLKLKPRALKLPLAKLSIDVSGDEPPKEFRIFRAGWNDAHGDPPRVLFDAKAAAILMADYAKHGVDRMIDLEHLSLDTESLAYDPDARGWCRLEVRNGELWAVDVRWTEDGAERLRQKKQRYISPAFAFDKHSRPTRMFNMALTALPATDDAQELIAASDDPQAALASGDQEMAEIDTQAIAKICEECAAACQACAEACNGGDVGAAISAASACMAACEACIAACATLSPSAAPAEEPATEGGPPPAPEDEEAVAAMSALLRETAQRTANAALSVIRTWRESHVARQATEAKSAAEALALETRERLDLAAQLVTIGAETSHTSGLAAGKLCARLSAEPIAELRERVKQLGGQRPRNPQPPVSTHTAGLTPDQIRLCAEYGVKPEEFAALRDRPTR